MAPELFVRGPGEAGFFLGGGLFLLLPLPGSLSYFEELMKNWEREMVVYKWFQKIIRQFTTIYHFKRHFFVFGHLTCTDGWMDGIGRFDGLRDWQ